MTRFEKLNNWDERMFQLKGRTDLLGELHKKGFLPDEIYKEYLRVIQLETVVLQIELEELKELA